MPRDRTPYMAPRFIYGSHAKDHLTGWAWLIHTISVRDSAQLVHVRASVCMLVYSSCKELCAFIVQLHRHISSIWLLEVMKQSLDYRNIALLHRKSAQVSIRIFAIPSEIRSHNLQPYAYHRTSALTTELSRLTNLCEACPHKKYSLILWKPWPCQIYAQSYTLIIVII